jgi:protein SCO1/2
MKHKKKFLFLVLIAYLIAFSILYYYQSSSSYYGFVAEREIEDFEFMDQNNNLFSKNDLSKNFSYVSFGFLNCNGICQIQMQKLRAIAQRLPQSNIQFLFITIDPERDSLARLHLFLKGSDLRFKALRTENHSILQKFLSNLQVQVSEDTISRIQGNLQFQHSNFIVLIHPSLKKLIYYPDGLDDIQKIEKDFYKYTK